MAFLALAPEAAEAATGAGEAAEGAGAAEGSAGAAGGAPSHAHPLKRRRAIRQQQQARRRAREDAAAEKDHAAGEWLEGDQGEEDQRPGLKDHLKDAAAPLAAPPRMEKWHTTGGAVLGAVGWVLFTNFMQGGMPQVRRWGAAKFLNKTPTTGGSK